MKEATTDFNIGLKETELENLKKAKEDLKEIDDYLTKSVHSSKTAGISYEQKDFDYIFTKKLGKTEEDLKNLKEAVAICGLEFEDLFDSFGNFTPELNMFDETIKQVTNDVEHFNKTEKFNVNLDGLSSSLSTIESLTNAYEKLANNQQLSGAELTYSTKFGACPVCSRNG